METLLRRERFVEADLRAIHAGEAVVKSLDTPVRQELAVFGVVHVEAPAARFVDRFGDIERFERGPGIPQIGRFGNPPRLEDLASLTLPAKDVAALASCRPGDMRHEALDRVDDPLPESSRLVISEFVASSPRRSPAR